MKIIVSLQFFLYPLAFGFSTELDNEANIMGGNPALIYQFPYQVSLKINDVHKCGGAIISDLHILTAGHCIVGLVFPSYSNIKVIMGTSFQRSRGESHSVFNIHVHPRYNELNAYANDIAVITLVEEILFNNYQLPISLPTTSTIPFEAGTIAGWGTRDYNTDTESSILFQLDVMTITNRECHRIHRSPIHSTQICTVSTQGSVSMGDSGSPLVIDNEVVGIVSWSTCHMSTPDVHTRVYNYLDFIGNIINE